MPGRGRGRGRYADDDDDDGQGRTPRRRVSRQPRSPSPSETYPFLEKDPFCDAVLLVDEERFYTSQVLLAYNSPVIYHLLCQGEEGEEWRKEDNKEIDLTGRDSQGVKEFLAWCDPRVNYKLTEDRATRVLPIAKEYDVRKLMTQCEEVITSSYKQQHECRRYGDMPCEHTLHYLFIADRYEFEELLALCEREYSLTRDHEATGKLREAVEISEPVKMCVMEKMVERKKYELAKQKRIIVTPSERRKQWRKN